MNPKKVVTTNPLPQESPLARCMWPGSERRQTEHTAEQACCNSYQQIGTLDDACLPPPPSSHASGPGMNKCLHPYPCPLSPPPSRYISHVHAKRCSPCSLPRTKWRGFPNSGRRSAKIFLAPQCITFLPLLEITMIARRGPTTQEGDCYHQYLPSTPNSMSLILFTPLHFPVASKMLYSTFFLFLRLMLVGSILCNFFFVQTLSAQKGEKFYSLK